MLWGLLVLAITALTRNMAAGIAGVLIWGLIAENLLAAFLIDRAPAIVDLLPIGRDLVGCKQVRPTSFSRWWV